MEPIKSNMRGVVFFSIIIIIWYNKIFIIILILFAAHFFSWYFSQPMSTDPYSALMQSLKSITLWEVFSFKRKYKIILIFISIEICTGLRQFPDVLLLTNFSSYTSGKKAGKKGIFFLETVWNVFKLFSLLNNHFKTHIFIYLFCKVKKLKEKHILEIIVFLFHFIEENDSYRKN